MKRPRSPCFAACKRRRRFEARRLHNAAAAAAPLLRRKRTVQDCGFYRTPGPPPEKRPRLEGVDDSHAFLWEVQATPKEQTFGKDSKHNKQHSKNGGNNGVAGGGSGGPAVTAALVQSPATSPMEDAALPLMVDTAGGGKPEEELLTTAAAAAVEMAGPPLPADAAMMEVAGTPSDEDDPAFNAFNYWKTPFPDVNADVIME